jgi:nucleolar complex protein 2
MPQSKATKRFEKKHLGDVLRKRKEVKKIKQRQLLKDKRKAKKAKEDIHDAAVESRKQKVNTDALNALSVDDFFQNGIEIPKYPSANRNTSSTGNNKRKHIEISDEEELSEQLSDLETSLASDQISERESDSASDIDVARTHKDELAALASKDPEFYKYLQENEAELLDFNPDADLAGLTNTDVDDSENVPRKRQKRELEDDGQRGEVTQSLVAKWESSMVEQRSLRSSKEVLLAFGSAVASSGKDDKQFKYTVSDPEGIHHKFFPS